MTLQELHTLKNAGNFHHATYRSIGTLWEGLWIYGKDPNGFGGYNVVGCFLAGSPELPAAEESVRGTGVGVGAYGRG